MKPKIRIKLAADIAMTAVLLLLMAYELIGQAAHEWIGAAMFALFLLHHILNSRWSRNLPKGRYTAMRVWQTGLVIWIMLFMLGSMCSGVILSRHVFSFLHIKGLRSFARNLHMISAYWGFVFMSLHIGFHWNMMMGMMRKFAVKPSVCRSWMLRAGAAIIAGYGVYAFIRREIGHYMLLQNQFVFFDFEEPLVLFLLDYLAVMGLFVFVGHYFTGLLRHFSVNRSAHLLR